MSFSRKAFTLIELLIVIAIIAILSITVVLTLNPAEMLRQARDSTRTSDMSTLQSALNLYVTDTSVSGAPQLGLINTVYVSLPDASSTCGSWGLPALPTGWSYHCANATSSKNIDANGWIPVNLKTMSLGSSLGSLPIDPINSSSTGLYYTYQTDGQKYEVTSIFESSKYKAQYAQNPQVPGYPEVLAEGSNLSLSPLWNPSGLVGYWPLDEGTGTVVTDQSGNGNGGTWVGNLINGSHYTSGKVGMAGNFDGSSNYINGGSNNLPSGSAPRSAFMWVNFGAPTGEMGIFAYGTSGLTTQWSSLMRLTSGQLYFSGWQDDFGTSFHPPTNSWHFVGYVYVGGTSVAVYYDGQSQVGAISQSLSTTLTATSIIGGESSSGANSFNGQIDDVRIYNRALSASEVQALYNAEK